MFVLPAVDKFPSKIVAVPASKQTMESTAKSAVGPLYTQTVFTIESVQPSLIEVTCNFIS